MSRQGHDVGPTIEELRAICQPPAIVGRRQHEHWAGQLYLRYLSIYVTRMLIRTPITANGVTALMIAAGLLGGVVMSVPTLWGAIGAALLAQTHMLLDCCDGEVARWRRTESPAGIYLDRVGHYVVDVALFVGLGFRAASEGGPGWVSVGLLGAVLTVLIWAEGDLVYVARARSGLPGFTDDDVLPRDRRLRRLRLIAARLPLNRVVHAVEMTLLVVVAAAVDAVAGSLVGTHVLLSGLVAVAAIVVVTHLFAILASSRLR